MTAPWQRTFAAFAGPGIAHPSDTLRVTDGDAAAILADLAGETWQPAAPAGEGRHRDYSLRHTADLGTTALFLGGVIVGFYAGSYLWLRREHQGRGLSTPLILAAAAVRGGTVLPPGVALQGYTHAGLAAHRAAHTHAILTALAEGRPVPHQVAMAATSADYAAGDDASATLAKR